jgi:hypothetical protein
MDKQEIVKLVDEVVEGLMEGGPGSGRYPEGSGKHPDAEDNVGGTKMQIPTSILDRKEQAIPIKKIHKVVDEIKKQAKKAGFVYDRQAWKDEPNGISRSSYFFNDKQGNRVFRIATEHYPFDPDKNKLEIIKMN